MNNVSAQNGSPELKTYVVHYYAPITPASFNSFRNCVMEALQRQNVKEFKFFISSEGGDLNSGFTAYNFIRSLPVETTCINMGTIESIAILPFLAGKNRFAVKDSRFLLHSFHWTFLNAPIDHVRLLEHSGALDFDAERYAKIFDERTQGAQSPVDIRKHLKGEALILDPAAATDAGLIRNVVKTEGRISCDDLHWWVNQF